MVVGYRMKPFTFWLAKTSGEDSDYVSLPNLLAGRELVKELLQDECQLVCFTRGCEQYRNNGRTSHAMHLLHLPRAAPANSL